MRHLTFVLNAHASVVLKLTRSTVGIGIDSWVFKKGGLRGR